MERALFLSLIGTSVCVLFRSLRPEYTLPAAVITGVLVLGSVFSDLLGVTETVQRLADALGVPLSYGAVLFKMIAIAYLTAFGANVCRDQGVSSLASKLELGGRVAVVACAMPSVITLLETGLALLNGGLS